MQDDSVETSAEKAPSEPSAPTSEQMGCEVSGTVMVLLGEHHRRALGYYLCIASVQ